ncbi:MAG: QueT transporter family protein [Clostridia bacterium]|nr:QueT transporter family protein [Clostridia bacterium]MBO7170036.1 QueT transporter family protein [Clostridia bacterium]
MKDRKASRIRFLTYSAAIAALYVGLTYLSFLFGLDKGVVQVRFSEALCVLAAFTPAAIPGMTLGCFLAGLLTSAHPIDMAVGSMATLLGVLGCWLLRFLKDRRLAFCLLPLPNVLSNALIIPWVLSVAYGATEGYFFLFLTVGAGEVISAGVLGSLLLWVLKRRRSLF